MCGIHFVISNNKAATGLSGFMKNAFLANQVRGTDSSGVFQVKHTLNDKGLRNVELFKRAVSGTDFIDTQGAASILNGCGANLATVGHVRAATQGNVVDGNAHPFTVIREDGSRLIGVHNGSLTNWKNKTGGDEYDVDSKWLYSKIAQDGIAAFDAIEGPFALVWFDSNHPDHMFVARNKDRPLFWAVSEDNKSMVAASELGMLGWLVERNGIKLGKWAGDDYFSYAEERHLYKINMLDLNDITKTELPKLGTWPRRYEKPYVPTSYVPQSQHMSNHVPFLERRQNEILSGIRNVLAPAVTALEAAPLRPATKPASDDYEPAPRQLAAIDKEDVAIDIGSLTEEERQSVAGFLGTEADLLGLGKAVDLEDPDAEVGVVDERNFEYLHSPPKSSVSEEEIKRARSAGIYGLCVKFFGVMYDDSGEMYGEFRTREGGTLVSYDSLVRGVTSGMAKHRYERKEGFDMVVVGISKSRNPKSTPFIILDERSKARMQNAYAHPPQETSNAQNMDPSPSRMLH